MIKSSRFGSTLEESRGWWDRGRGKRGEWTYEGDRKCVRTSSSRREPHPLARRPVWFVQGKSGRNFVKLGGTAGF